MTNDIVRQEARNAWHRGWTPVPMRPEKFPALKWRQYQTTRPSLHMVNHWFCPNSKFELWGLIHGSLSGTVVLDFDNKAQFGGVGLVMHDLEDEFGDLPHTVSVETPSGGIHMFFKHPILAGQDIRVPTRKNLRSGFDVRGDGGFSAGAGSTTPAGIYRWFDHPDKVHLAELPERWLVFITEDYIMPSATNKSSTTQQMGDVTFENFPTSFGGFMELAVDGRETWAVQTIWRTRRYLYGKLGREPDFDELRRGAWGAFATTTDVSRPMTTWSFDDRVRKILRKNMK